MKTIPISRPSVWRDAILITRATALVENDRIGREQTKELRKILRELDERQTRQAA